MIHIKVRFSSKEDPSRSPFHIIALTEKGAREALTGCQAPKKSLELLKLKGFKGKLGDWAEHGCLEEEENTFFLGTGAPDPQAQDRWYYDLGGRLFDRIKASASMAWSLALPGFKDEDILKVVFGCCLKAWRFDKYKNKALSCELDLTVKVENPKTMDESYKVYQSLQESIYLTRDLVAEPGNVLYPESFIERMKENLEPLGVVVEVLDQKAMEAKGFGALLGVASGSQYPPFLGIMKWRGGSQEGFPLGLVGKGVTFDSGGLSLKPAQSMEDMKVDMAGAAAVVGTLSHLARTKAPISVVGVVALVENMVSQSSQRPGDIVRSLSGKTVEVLNTDAEGRLILADALWYIQEAFSPKTVIDLATLTGAVAVALGPVYAGAFSDSDVLWESMWQSGQKVGEKVWRLPMGKEFEKPLKSKVADLQNIASRGFGAGSATAAQFLKNFIQEKTHWMHLDIASVESFPQACGIGEKGPSGFGVLLLNEFIQRYF